MPTQRVRRFLKQRPENLEVIEIDGNTHTSELAARALGVEVAQIAKSLVFLLKGAPALVVTCGDMRVDMKKLKEALGQTGKVSLADPRQAEEITGFPPGGVCPFALNTPMPILLDQSLGRFPVVYAAAGSAHSLVPISLENLKAVTGGKVLDVCR
jgi:prolyl-tRNA editing enzyme YbaK/EbsC (Cys-tRNA(Pro) deacylase)